MLAMSTQRQQQADDQGRIRSCLSSLKSRLPKSPLTYFLFCVFGIGSWIAVNGVWAEISVLTLTLPECFKLPAYLVVAIQIANVGPLLYTVVKYFFQLCGGVSKQIHLERVTVALIVAIGVAACVLLALFWDKNVPLFGGSSKSVTIIVLTFFLALVDCTSSVVFIPFMKHFPEEYISALYIGEGLSGVLPSAVALSQGFVNNSLKCSGSYPGHRALGIHFSPNVFFVFLAGMMLVCGFAFLLINVLPPVRKHMVTYKYVQFKIKGNSRATTPAASEANLLPHERRLIFGGDVLEEEEEEIMVEDDEGQSPPGDPVHGANHERHIETELSDDAEPVTPPRSMTPPPDKSIESEHPASIVASITSSVKFHANVTKKNKNKIETRVASGLSLTPARFRSAPSFSFYNVLIILWKNSTIFVCLALLNFMTNGVLSAVSSYSFFPYGNDIYHLAINLALLANPVMSLLYVVFPYKSRDLTAVLTSVALVLGIYVMTVAALSPDPPLKDNVIGKIIIVVANTCVSGLVSYTKVGVVVQLHARERDKDTALLLAGVVTQLSSLVGAVLLFALVNYTQVFKNPFS